MECASKEVDLEVILNRIHQNELNLQPSFQRGEVWSLVKQKRLIDSILRGWKIPPIHVIETSCFKEEVLDGQQRLVAIKDFYNNKFSIDGKIMPTNPEILLLDSLTYDELPPQYQRKFKKFAITQITLTHHLPEEPAELFYRLNQPATLTSAEQRNAYMSPSRNQIKEMVQLFEVNNAKTETIGFSNSRLAYDEIVSKFAYILEIGTLKKKVTSSDMSNKYRQESPFEDTVINAVKTTIQRLMHAVNLNNNSVKIKFNKATLFSWFIYIHANPKIENQQLSDLIYIFEGCRQTSKGHTNSKMAGRNNFLEELKEKHPFLDSMFLVFNQRASMGSTDALSIIYRDIILNIFNCLINQKTSELLKFVTNIYADTQSFNKCLDSIYQEYTWGVSI